jgi:hypothetical protein
VSDIKDYFQSVDKSNQLWNWILAKRKMLWKIYLNPNLNFSLKSNIFLERVINTCIKPLDRPWRKRMVLSVKELERDPVKPCVICFELMFFALQWTRELDPVAPTFWRQWRAGHTVTWCTGMGHSWPVGPCCSAFGRGWYTMQYSVLFWFIYFRHV